MHAGGMGHLWKDRSVTDLDKLWMSRERPGREDMSFREECSFAAATPSPPQVWTQPGEGWVGPAGLRASNALLSSPRVVLQN